MAILKSEIRNKFTTIPNSIVRAKDLSDGDYRLLIYLYSLPNAWKINQSYLGQELNCTRENINKKIARIKKAGYLEIIKNSNNDKDIDYIYNLKEKCVSENNTCDSNQHIPLCQLATHVIASDTYINTDNKVINNINKKEEGFQKPTVEEIKEYCSERKNEIDPLQFYNFYESKGWLIGKSKMKDWKAAVRTWESRENKKNNNKFTSFNDL